jgi:hypothetical protein
MKWFNKMYRVTMLTAVLLCMLNACSKMDAYKKDFLSGGEIIYAGALDTIIAQPGYKRINLKMVLGTDPQVIKVKAYWNDFKDSMDLAVTRPLTTDTVNMLVSGLDGKSYTFYVYTLDKANNKSVAKIVTETAYGDDYLNALPNRTILSVAPNTNVDSMLIKWNEANSGQVLTELTYTSPANEQKKVRMKASVYTYALGELEYKGGSSLSYRSAYLPKANAFDTFWVTTPSVVTLPVIPPYERQFQKSLFAIYRLPTDIGASQYTTWPMTNLWNGLITGTGYATAVGPTPVWFTFDMGQSAKINRFMYWMPQDRIFNLESVKKFEIYGSNQPAADGTWDSWTFLSTCESIKLSGSAAGTNTAADVAAATAGQEFIMPTNIPKTRYIRIKVLEHWGVGTFQAMGELTFYTRDRP